MSFPFADVERAINRLHSRLRLTPNSRLQQEFDAGLHPNLLSYQRQKSGGVSSTALDRLLIGATSYLHQPSNYYDIYGAGRCVIAVQLLEAALEVLQAKLVKGTATRVERLVQAVASDEFDSIVFELIAAARYALLPAVDHVAFIDEQPPKHTPDFLITSGQAESFVECKKVVRVRDYGIATRNAVRELLNDVIFSFRRQGTSVLAEVAFNCDPKGVSRSGLFDACEAALNDRVAIITSQFTAKARLLPKCESKGYMLFPSPKFSWDRYGYRIRGEWFGVIHQLSGRPACLADLPQYLRGGVSTWLDSVDWDAAIKWKITDEEAVGKYRRFAFDGLFDAIKQIDGAGLDSTVHVWLETDYFIGTRREVLRDLFSRLSANAQKPVGWIVINETLLDVSPKGRFDLIEHAHMIQGPLATGQYPLISGVFGLPIPASTVGEFGVGHELPDIDED